MARRRRRGRERIVVGLDVGTTKVACLVANVVDSEIEIIGMGTAPSRGLDKGVVVDIGRTIQSIRKAVEEAENMADVKIRSVYVGIAGQHIRSINTTGTVAITHPGRVIKRSDIRRVIDAAKAVPVPPDMQLIHVIPRQYKVDGQEGITDPEGMTGTRLEADVHLVLGSVTAVRNLVRCIKYLRIDVEQIVLQPLASSLAVLSSAEKELGVVLLDIGGGTTDISIYKGGDIWFSKVIPVAGQHITNDITVGLQTPIEEAERIKKEYGTCLVDSVDDNEKIEIATIGGDGTKLVSRKRLAKIIEARVEEILDLAMEEVENAGYKDIVPGGLVITGGTALLDGIVEFAQARYGLPARRGQIPQGIHGLRDIVESPIYATAIGLLKYAVEFKKLEPQESRGGWFNTVLAWLRSILWGG